MKFEKNGHQLGKTEVAFIILVLVSLVAVALYSLNSGNKKQSSINDFESCVAAGNPVNMSYPETCNANGQVFSNPSHNSLDSD